MKNIGVICEYNPFHNGHARQLAAMRAQGSAICLMSGNYVQRGEPALLDKHLRARAAISAGADLVLELPITCALRSAEGFAAGGVKILSSLGFVDSLCFGSETGTAETLLQTARLLRTEEFSLALRRELKSGVSFPRARQLALEAIGGGGAPVEHPNDILAVEYCKAILATGGTLMPMVLRRAGSYHDSLDPENPSASALRAMDDWTGYVPDEALALMRTGQRHTVQAGERAWLARLRFMPEEEFEALPYGGEGLWRKVARACREERTLEDIVQAAKSRRYTRTRLMRLLLCAFLGVTEQRLAQPAPYVRILAMNARGQALLRQGKKTGSVCLVHPGQTPPDREYWELERRAADLYGLFAAQSIGAPAAEKKSRIYRKTAE